MGQCEKGKVAKSDCMENACYVMFGLSFCERMHMYPLPIHCTEILRNKTSC